MNSKKKIKINKNRTVLAFFVSKKPSKKQSQIKKTKKTYLVFVAYANTGYTYWIWFEIRQQSLSFCIINTYLTNFSAVLRSFTFFYFYFFFNEIHKAKHKTQNSTEQQRRKRCIILYCVFFIFFICQTHVAVTKVTKNKKNCL